MCVYLAHWPLRLGVHTSVSVPMIGLVDYPGQVCHLLWYKFCMRSQVYPIRYTSTWHNPCRMYPLRYTPWHQTCLISAWHRSCFNPLLAPNLQASKYQATNQNAPPCGTFAPHSLRHNPCRPTPITLSYQKLSGTAIALSGWRNGSGSR